MKEHPILFSGPMVRAIVEGRKTQTRRVVNPQPSNDAKVWHNLNTGLFDVRRCSPWYSLRCPYGKPGDDLWVRETWGYIEQRKPERKKHIFYRADSPDALSRWKPSIHMPRWVSRLTVKITDVSVQRLQHLTEEDVHAEGCVLIEREDAVSHFSATWNHINAKRGFAWDVNPWVWVISFQLLHMASAHDQEESDEAE